MWTPLPAQRVALESPADEVFMIGQGGSGATDLLLFAPLYFPPGSEFILVKPVEAFPEATERIGSVLPGSVLGTEVCYPNGNRLIFQPGPSPLNGSRHLLIDTIGNVGWETFDALLRIQREAWNRQAPRPKVIAAGTPPVEAGSWLRQYLSAWIARTYAGGVIGYGTPDPTTGLTFSRTLIPSEDVNPYLPAEYAGQLASLPRGALRAALHGEWVAG